MIPARSVLLLVVVLTAAGCPGPTKPQAVQPSQEAAPAAEPAAEAAPPAAEPAAETAPPPQNPLHREAKLVDRNAFLQQHPNATEIEKNVINAKDPLTAVTQGYFAATSSLTASALKHDLDLWYQLNNERWPTFAEYKQILDQHDVKLKGLKPRQVYAYDASNGQVSILEVPEGESIE